jgi:hypothetical protein
MRYLIAILAIAGFVEVTAAAMRAHGAETSSSIAGPARSR